jgi:phospholipase/lecithinase/hemolysin
MSLQRLYHLGARNIWFTGLAPLGCIPSQRVLSETGECLEDVNGYAVRFNAAAKELLEGLNAKLPGARMSLADCYSVVMELIQHPRKYGNNNRNFPRTNLSHVLVVRPW